MAITQNTTTDVTAPPVICLKDDTGLFYFEQGGGTRRYYGTGAPVTAATPCPIGSLYTDKTTGILYICTVVTGTWTKVGAQT